MDDEVGLINEQLRHMIDVIDGRLERIKFNQEHLKELIAHRLSHIEKQAKDLAQRWEQASGVNLPRRIACLRSSHSPRSRTQRKPVTLVAKPGSTGSRKAVRTEKAAWANQSPPRKMRFSPVAGPVGSLRSPPE